MRPTRLKSKFKSRGMSLVEVLIAIFIFVTMSGGIYAAGMVLSKVMKQNVVMLAFQANLRSGLQKIAWQVRSVRFPVMDEDVANQVNFSFLAPGDIEKKGKLYFQSNQILIQYDVDAPQVLLKNVDTVTLSANKDTSVVKITNLKTKYLDNLKNKDVVLDLNLALQCQGLR